MALTRPVLILLLAAQAWACKPRGLSTVKEGFSALNDPKEFGIDDLSWRGVPLAIRLDKVGWSGYYWAYSVGGINYAWQKPGEVAQRAQAKALANAKAEAKARHAENLRIIASRFASEKASRRNLAAYESSVNGWLAQAEAATDLASLQTALNGIDAFVNAANTDIAAINANGPFLRRPRWVIDQYGRMLLYAQDYMFDPMGEAQAAALNDAQVGLLSPAEKYDMVMGSSFALVKETNERIHGLLKENGAIAPWEGVCNGWSMAALMVPEPGDGLKVRDASGKHCVAFRRADLKALASAAMAQSRARTKNLGERCMRFDAAALAAATRDRNNEIAKHQDEELRKCMDANPGAVFAVITKRLAKGKPVVVEIGLDHEVWNHPLVGYALSYFDPDNLQAGFSRQAIVKANDGKPYRAKGTAKIVPVAMEIEFLVEHQPQENDRRTQKRTLMFELEVAQDDTILGGTWFYNPHDLSALTSIDYLWTIEDEVGDVASIRPETLDLYYVRKLIDMSLQANANYCGANEVPFRAQVTQTLAANRRQILAKEEEYRKRVAEGAAAQSFAGLGGKAEDILKRASLLVDEGKAKETAPMAVKSTDKVEEHAAVPAKELDPAEKRLVCLGIKDAPSCRKVDWCSFAADKCFSVESRVCGDYPTERHCAPYLGCAWEKGQCVRK